MGIFGILQSTLAQNSTPEVSFKGDASLDGIDPALTQVASASPIPFTVTSGLRSKAANAKVGGVPNSQHLTGSAIDIRTRDKSPQELAALTKHFESNGFQVLDEGDHLHIQRPRTGARINFNHPPPSVTSGADIMPEDPNLGAASANQQLDLSSLLPPQESGGSSTLLKILNGLATGGGLAANVIGAIKGNPGAGNAGLALGLKGFQKAEDRKLKRQKQEALVGLAESSNIDPTAAGAAVLSEDPKVLAQAIVEQNKFTRDQKAQLAKEGRVFDQKVALAKIREQLRRERQINVPLERMDKLFARFAELKKQFDEEQSVASEKKLKTFLKTSPSWFREMVEEDDSLDVSDDDLATLADF